MTDTHILVSAIGMGKGLKPGMMPNMGGPGMIPTNIRPQGMNSISPGPNQMGKAQSAIKTNIKSANQIHPYGTDVKEQFNRLSKLRSTQLNKDFLLFSLLYFSSKSSLNKIHTKFEQDSYFKTSWKTRNYYVICLIAFLIGVRSRIIIRKKRF